MLETHPEIEQAHVTTNVSDIMMVPRVKSPKAGLIRAVCLFEEQISKVAPIVAQSSLARRVTLDSHMRS